eukprot:scaffold133630_cov39-Tisochrysis_lutea.AAC.3
MASRCGATRSQGAPWRESEKRVASSARMASRRATVRKPELHVTPSLRPLLPLNSSQRAACLS